MSKWRHKIIVLVAACMLLSACTARESTSVSAPLQEEDNQENGQVLTVVNPETAKSEDTAVESSKKKYQIQTRLTDFHLLTETTGIAWGITRGELRLYTTNDQGRTWTNISPAATVQFPGLVRYGEEMFFLDQGHGWIMRKAQGSTEGILLHTEDGGLNWKISSLPANASPSSVYFTTAERGWLISVSPTSPGNQKKSVYNTYDGGSTWVASKDEVVSSGQTGSLINLPQYGYFADMDFTTEQQGFALIQEIKKPDLYTTKDGGQHWMQSNTFFRKQDLGECDSYTAEQIQFFNESGQTGLIPIRCTKGDTSKYSGYFTSDGAATFQFIDFPLPWQSGVNAGLAPYFVNEMEGWSLQGYLLYHTIDQGKTWRALPENRKLATTLDDYPEVVKLQFVSPNYGWMLVQNSEERTSRLLSTHDGGLSWQML
ncbi:WD40/YVTN/BNR-like repeat-containing protein [Paenibacillus physcomitrellae]|uniref:Photosynthesis system II assembly factor Ycf48/Hcf136-like domain-containing protein n=1 Tax=Paenibacillus physcomitrellae TaxID=1619311 RepID=A0ABQ1FR13_9BACL|nr:hypothetical protein [Paenibacillus physcomitrellae]GGA25483.1 hypothetical protein GCM10010917_08010 [Paenibacillus physcomitrellae]